MDIGCRNRGRAPAVVVAAAAFLVGGCAAPSGGGADASGSAQVQRAMDAVFPALVRIHVVVLDYSGGREQKFEASGSGAIISPEGHIVTNHHVAGRATMITVTLSTREEVPATLVGSDPLADLAVIKLDLAARRDPTAPVRHASFGDSDALRVGDRVLAMGSPLSLSQSVTSGIVSNTAMMLPARFAGSFELDGEDVGTLVRWIGHDAVIFPGNSGGPLVNIAGEVVGINDIGYGLGGAIPANLAKRVVADIIANGEVRRSWTGLEFQPLLRGSPVEAGVLVAGVVSGSPAEAAGVKSGDILVSFDGEAVSARFHEELPAVNRRMLETPVGATVALGVIRDGVPTTLSLTTAPRRKARGDEREYRGWGMSGQELTPTWATEMKREPGSGVLIASMRDGGPTADAKPPLQQWDVITEVGGRPVRSLADLTAATDAVVGGRTEPVPALVAIERRREKILTVVKLGPEQEDRSTEARKAWFPAAFQVLTRQLAESLGLPGRTGVRLTHVFAGAEAEKAGLLAGDIIVAMDGDPIPASQPEDVQVFPHMVRQRKIGSTTTLTVIRGGAERTIDVTLPSRPPEGRELATYRNDTFEFSVREVSFKDRVDQRWGSDSTGAVVATVQPGGWAAFADLRGGDLVLAIDGRAVDGVSAVKAAMEAVEASKPAQVAFQVRRGVHSLFVEVRPAWPAGR